MVFILSARLQRCFHYRQTSLLGQALTVILILILTFFFMVSCSPYVYCRWFNSITAEFHHVLLTVLSRGIACIALVKILIDDGRTGAFAEQTKQGTVTIVILQSDWKVSLL